MAGVTWQTVGVLGGFGPEATVDFYQRVLDYAKKRVTDARANTGYPKMIIYNCNFIPFDTSDTSKMRANPELLKVAKKVEEAGANFIVIPSNTPYLFYDEISASVSVPILHIVEETAKAARARKVKKVAVIPAHPEVGKLYQKYLEKYGIEVETPDAASFKGLTENIEEFMAGRRIAAAKRFLATLMNSFSKTADITILACTELPLILRNDLKNYRFLDSTQVLVEVTVERALKPTYGGMRRTLDKLMKSGKQGVNLSKFVREDRKRH